MLPGSLGKFGFPVSLCFMWGWYNTDLLSVLGFLLGFTCGWIWL